MNTLLDQGCFLRGCACYDSRTDRTPPVEVISVYAVNTRAQGQALELEGILTELELGKGLDKISLMTLQRVISTLHKGAKNAI